MTTTPRQVVEDFYRMAASEKIKEKHLLVTLSPWPSDAEPPPSKVLVLDRMDEEQIQVALSHVDCVIAGSTFSTDEELEFAAKYLPILSKRDSNEKKGVCVILFQLATPEMNKTRASIDRHLEKINSITGLGMDEMVLLPELKTNLFHQKLEIALMTWQSNVERITEMLSHEVRRPSDADIENLQNWHKALLWHEIPSALMPKFAKLDASLVQTPTHIGKYAWMEGQQTLNDNDYHYGAMDEDGKVVSVKVIDKERVFTADDLEGLFREYRFLSDVLEHPNLPKCIDMLHGPEKVYFIYDGPCLPSVNGLLQSMDGKRASSAVSLEAFKRLAAVVTYMHSRSCAHRNINLRSVHLRLDENNDALLDLKLFDFEKAVQVRGGQSAIASYGSFPSMAPEMIHGEAYVPRHADCWSTGVLLLEMAGGLGSLESCIQADFKGDRKASLIRIETFFLTADCHRIALTFLGAPPNDEIVTYLQRTLQTRPENRREMADMFID